MDKFEYGQLVATADMTVKMESDDAFKDFVFESIKRYSSCDWGDTCDEDKQLNDDAVKNGERVLAVYACPATGEKIWIITEWDRSVTTILFPDEY